jgi:hypothetical protein
MKRVLGILALLAWLSAGSVFCQAPKLVPRQVVELALPFGHALGDFNRDGTLLITVQSAGQTGRDSIILWHVCRAQKHIEVEHRLWSMVRLAPDGKTLATEGENFTLRLWDTDTGAQKVTLEGHTDEIQWVEFSPDGKRLITVSRDKTAKLWDLETGTVVASLSIPADEFLVPMFAPDARVLLRRWQGDEFTDLTTGEVHAGIPAPKLKTVSVHSADGSTIATICHVDGSVQIWKTLTLEKLLETSTIPTSGGYTLSDDGRWLAFRHVDFASARGRLKEWVDGHFHYLSRFVDRPEGATVLDVTTGQTWTGFPRYDRAKFLPDGKTLITARGGKLEFWDIPPTRKSYPAFLWLALALALGLTVAWFYSHLRRPKGGASQ